MNIDKAVGQWLANGNGVSPDIAAILSDSGARQALYKVLLDQPPAPFRQLLWKAFEYEIAFRDALFHGDCEDPKDHSEGIYRCAFLLYRVGDVSDVLSLWSAKQLNMDVGSSLGAEYFLGAGIADTTAYLDGWSEPDAIALLDYINEFLAYEQGKWSCREQWEREQIDNIRRS